MSDSNVILTWNTSTNLTAAQLNGLMEGDDRDFQIECLTDDLQYLRESIKDILGCPKDLEDEQLIECLSEYVGRRKQKIEYRALGK